MVRMASDHKVKAFTLTNYVFDEREFWKIDKDTSATVENLNSIHHKTNIDKKRIYDTTLKSYEGKLMAQIRTDRSRTWIIHQARLKGTITNNYIVYCSKCLEKDAETPFFRKRWRLGLSFCCVKCKILLRDNCQNCQKPILFFNHTIGVGKDINIPMNYCYNCGFDLSKAKTQIPTEVELQNQNYLYELLDNGCNEIFNYSHLYFDVLLHLCHRMISSEKKHLLNEILSKELQKSLLTEKKTGEFCSLSLTDRTKIINASMWLLDFWPKRFLNVCQKNDLSYHHFFRKRKFEPFWFYKVVKDELYRGKPARFG